MSVTPSSPLRDRGPRAADSVLDHIVAGTQLVVPLANGEPVTVMAALDHHAARLRDVVVHQMHALHDHPYLHGVHHGHLDHRSYFLSPVTRPAFHRGTVDLVPCHFSEVPLLLGRLRGPTLALASVSPPDAHGYFTLGTNADYMASFIGRVPFFVEVNARMPRTQGRNELHVSHVVGWTETDYALIEPTLANFVQEGKKVVSCVPPGGKACALPHPEIDHLQAIAAGTRC